MALVQLFSHSINFNLNLPTLKRKSSFLATKSFNFPYPIQCKASNNVQKSQPLIIQRRSANYQPSSWPYDYIQSLNSEYKKELYTKEASALREDVRMMLCKVVNHVEQLEMIDILQRLGVAYHFKNEIRNILDEIYYMDSFKRKENLYATSLEFRLLRQHGYDILTDVFDSFHDETGSFKKCQSVDAKDMLSLYEASFHSLEGEALLDEARDFTSNFLKEYVDKNQGSHVSIHINHALKLPLHWRVPRLEAQWFINLYETSHNMNPTLLQFAKLDFNIVQANYQEELKYTSRWWKRTGLVENLSFFRDRLMENYVWTVGTNFNPDLGNFRRIITKVNCLITTIDDIYDVYGTLEELELFTTAIDRWDQNYAMDNLPYYMKICFYALYNFVNEVGFEMLKMNGINITPYLKKGWADLCKTYLIESKWYHKGYTPSLEEYIENGWISISAPVILVHAYFLIPNSFRKEDLIHLEQYHNIIRLSGMLLRLYNDLASFKQKKEAGDVPKSVECYMNEMGASGDEACEHVKSMISTTWKMMNEEVRNSSFCQDFIDMAVNLGRMSIFFYQYGEGYTVQDLKTKSRIISLIVQSI